MPVDRVAFAGEIVAVVVARTAAEARDAAELVDVEYDELPAALDLKEAAAGQGARPPRPRHQQVGASGSSTPREAGTGGNVDEAIEKARADGIVIEREYRQQRLIPAFMEPRSVVVDPTGEQITMWSATQIPHILRFALAATTGVSGVEDPGDRTRRRRRLRRQAPVNARGVDRLSRWPAGSASRSSTPRPARSR